MRPAEPCSARASEIFVRQVEQILVVRIRVHRGHPTLAQPEALVDHLCNWRETVGRAGCVRDDVVLGRVVLVLVDPEDHGDIRSLRRRGDDDLFRTGRQMLGRVVTLGEEPCSFEDHVDAQIFPWELGRILHRKHFEPVAVHADAVVRCLYVGFEVA